MCLLSTKGAEGLLQFVECLSLPLFAGTVKSWENQLMTVVHSLPHCSVQYLNTMPARTVVVVLDGQIHSLLSAHSCCPQRDDGVASIDSFLCQLLCASTWKGKNSKKTLGSMPGTQNLRGHHLPKKESGVCRFMWGEFSIVILHCECPVLQSSMLGEEGGRNHLWGFSVYIFFCYLFTVWLIKQSCTLSILAR